MGGSIQEEEERDIHVISERGNNWKTEESEGGRGGKG